MRENNSKETGYAPLFFCYSILFVFLQGFLAILVGVTGVTSARVYADEPVESGVMESGTGGSGAAESGTSGSGAGDSDSGAKITAEQKSTLVDHCETIKDNLKSLQKTDSRARVYLGRYYETILTSFITPLNLRMVENNLSNSKLLENQTNFAARRDRFVNDYISYQQALEDLVGTNCKTEPEKFYEKLQTTREKRRTVNRDVTKLREMTGEQMKLVEALKDETK